MLQLSFQEYVNIEDDDEYSQWESHNALQILESDIGVIDPTNVKLVSTPRHSIKWILVTILLLIYFWAFGSSFCQFGRNTTLLFIASTLYMIE